MKKTLLILFIAASAMISVSSCNKETFVATEQTQPSVSLEPAVICTESSTRTSLVGNQVHWTSDDVIAVYDNTGYKSRFEITEVSGPSASFAGSVTEGTTQIYAVYPYVLSGTADGSTLTVTVPENQSSKSGSFAEEHNISVAKAVKTPGVEEVGDVVFRNVCSYIKFTVPEYIKDIRSVTFASNSVIAGEAEVDCSGDIPVLAVSPQGSKSITMEGAYEAGGTFWFVLAPVTLDGFTVTVTTPQATWQISRSTQVEMAAGNYRNLGTLVLEEVTASATASHTYDGTVLTGTAVTLNLDVPASVSSYDPIVHVVFDIVNSDGVPVRSVSSSDGLPVVVSEADGSWPYLPEGNYSVSGSYTLASGKTSGIATSFAVASPGKFTVKSKAYTSYSRYLSGNPQAANACDPLTIYGLTSADVSISSTILENANYSSIIGGASYALNGTAVDSDVVTVSSLGNNTVTTTYTFDGVTVTDSADCHITGLPYTMNVAANDSVSPWAEYGNVKWNSSGVLRLGYNLSDWFAKSSANVTKTFSIPGNVNIIVNSTGTAEGTGSTNLTRKNTTFSIAVSGSDIYSYTTTKGDEEQAYSCVDKAAVLSSSSATVKLNNSYSTASACTKVAGLTIGYGNL